LALLFGFRQAVTRRAYLIAGVALFAVKYAVDWALSAAFAEHAIGPLAYVNPVLDGRLDALGAYPQWLPFVMLIWALPFVWVGVSMSTRRAIDASAPPWLALLFFIPLVNYFLIVLLCAAPSTHSREQNEINRALDAHEARRAFSALARLRIAATSVLIAGLLGALAALLSVYGMQQYGSALFLGAPFLLGVVSGVLLNRPVRQSTGATVATAALSVTLSGGVLLVLAAEGGVCLAMAAVIAYPMAIVGALGGRALAAGRRPMQPTLSMLVAWPVLALMTGQDGERFPVRTTVSAIEIDASPEHVWENVVGFSPLPPPEEWLLQLGVACPLRARIEGEGVGAIRHCEFTTGDFVEPITHWEPPHRLAFDVTEQPPSMREWSPYEVVHAPHLHGGVQSLRGEFTLTRLPGNRTRLEGTTWYRVKMAPNAYWSLYVDHAIHVIHQRVLSHIGRLSAAP
jgi:uncharacterized membrane protein YhaH (DUF805 family)